MRLVCWNVNGLRTLKGYQPWFQLRNWEACVEELHADMLCIQEVKMTRKQLTQDLCVMDQFDAYYDLHPSKGYAGTATYIRKSVCVPVAAEVGITGHTGRAIGPPICELPASVDAALLKALDAEGRCVIVDCDLFVLINVTCGV
ncbi:unnamed protein product [Malassezia sympodialis ATCC 42132]|uniref:uncharacterized protein n=1 Tax=Malassezia sympodialis (strain ATCC 42132) TaxID=1230383 RepID=UPI0002C20FBE|nr:uncharacterized protein MSY001_2795 [Malassezia sympodialis ATCC 42132]CCV00090.1 unnamed protein product [Malassezia sympodialis ATCC 42132]|eukprot:XP_018741299.1 uncharacterized protein MSY001_2795 [Malassezia sympodialis ATCC 42132]